MDLAVKSNGVFTLFGWSVRKYRWIVILKEICQQVPDFICSLPAVYMGLAHNSSHRQENMHFLVII